jgi:hypothetical protein
MMHDAKISLAFNHKPCKLESCLTSFLGSLILIGHSSTNICNDYSYL